MMDSRETNRQALYIAYLISAIGNWMFRVGVLFCCYRTAEQSALGIAVVVLYVPIILSSALLAPFGDRSNRKITMIVLDLFRGMILAPLLWVDVQSHTEWLLCAVFFLSLSQPVFAGAQIGILRHSVAETELRKVLKTFANLDWLTNILGTALGAIVLSRLSFRDVILIDIGTFLVSAVIIVCAVRGGSPAAKLRPKEANRILWPSRVPLLAAFTVLFLNLGAGVINIFPTVVTLKVYQLPVSQMGPIYLFNGIGAFLGASSVGFVNERLGTRTTLALTSGLIALSVLLMANFRGLEWSIAASTAMLFFGQIFGVSASTFIISRYPQAQSSKGNGMFQLFTFLGVALNGLLYLFLGSRCEFRSFVMLSMAFTAAAAVFAIANCNVKSSRSEVYA
jgi:predicted MFS family arabinose efflux permease